MFSFPVDWGTKSIYLQSADSLLVFHAFDYAVCYQSIHVVCCDNQAGRCISLVDRVFEKRKNASEVSTMEQS